MLDNNKYTEYAGCGYQARLYILLSTDQLKIGIVSEIWEII